MKTDKEIFKIFTSYPRYLLKCAKIRTKSIYSLKSITLKEFERRTDGVLAPQDINAPTYVMEFQAQYDSNIYHRLIMEMASYAMEYKVNDIRGILIFLHKELDPKTNPWHYLAYSKNRVLRIVYLKEYIKDLEIKHPNHPMVVVFKPLLEKDLNTLIKYSRKWYKQLKMSRLPKNVKGHFASAFFRWLSARFPELSGEEIIKMIEIESLPRFEETRAYQDLFGIAEKQGEKRGEKRGEKLGEKRGEKRGEKTILLRAINRLKKMHTNGEIDDIVFHKICEPIQQDLEKVTKEINEMIKRQQKY
jgi:predicted transposase YdaD